jgi:hypothetical protein
LPFPICNVSLGTLGPKQKKEIKVTYECDTAKVMVTALTLKLSEGTNEITYTIKLSAIGKYPFITVDQKDFNFFSLLVGKTASKELTISNSSEVPTNFTIEKISDDGKDPSFTLSHTSACLLPNASQTITIKYTPIIADTTSCANYRISTQGGN